MSLQVMSHSHWSHMDYEATSNKIWGKFSSMTELSTLSWNVLVQNVRGRNVLVRNVKVQTVPWRNVLGAKRPGQKIPVAKRPGPKSQGVKRPECLSPKSPGAKNFLRFHFMIVKLPLWLWHFLRLLYDCEVLLLLSFKFDLWLVNLF